MALNPGRSPESDYFMQAGTMTAIQTAGNLSPVVVCPDAGRVIGIAINVHTVIDALTTFDVLVNGAELATAVDATLPNGTADETGVIMDLDGVVEVDIGDALQLQSNGEQVAATSADVAWVIRR